MGKCEGEISIICNLHFLHFTPNAGLVLQKCMVGQRAKCVREVSTFDPEREREKKDTLETGKYEENPGKGKDG